MTIARSRQISLQDTPYYHVVSRCVLRAFLCGEDTHSGQSYEHLRQWVVDKLGQLSRLSAILCSDEQPFCPCALSRWERARVRGGNRRVQ